MNSHDVNDLSSESRRNFAEIMAQKRNEYCKHYELYKDAEKMVRSGNLVITKLPIKVNNHHSCGGLIEKFIGTTIDNKTITVWCFYELDDSNSSILDNRGALKTSLYWGLQIELPNIVWLNKEKTDCFIASSIKMID